MDKKFVFLSGLPRSGSTLLSAILDQNPNVHAEGNSAMCQLMWDMHVSCNTSSKEQLEANSHVDLEYDLVSSIPKIYYKKISKPIIVDKCRSWTLGPNVELIKKYIGSDFKIIILFRSVNEILKSFMKLYLNNNVYSEEKLAKLLEPNSEPLMRSLDGIIRAKQENNPNNYLFICYNDLITKPQKTIEKIYKFCNWEPFTHDFDNIVNNHPENDLVYGLNGMHTIRNKISPSLLSTTIILPKKILKKSNEIDSKLKNVIG